VKRALVEGVSYNSSREGGRFKGLSPTFFKNNVTYLISINLLGGREMEEGNLFKVILNIYMADRLIKAGFNVVEVRPSSARRGRAAFIFENTPEFKTAFERLSKRR